MKKLIIGLLILSCFMPLLAQEKGTSEFSLGYGRGSSTLIFYDIGEIFVDVFSFGTVIYDNEKSTGAIHLGYKYSISKHFSLGAMFVYEQITTDVKYTDDVIAKTTNETYTIAIESDIRYVSKEHFQMYSGLGFGYTIGKQKYNSNSSSDPDYNDNVDLYNFQIIALGVRAGKSFGGFAELGFGYKGLLNLGISYQF